MKYCLLICYSVVIVWTLGCVGTSTQALKTDTTSTIKPYRTNCISETTKDLLIRWGVYTDSIGTLQGYEIDTDARLWRYTAYTSRSTYNRDSIGMIDKSQMCFFADTIRKTFLQIQSLYVMSKKCHFIEYQNPTNKVSLRAMWDSRFQTYGSKEFRSIFDSLNTVGKVQN